MVWHVKIILSMSNFQAGPLIFGPKSCVGSVCTKNPGATQPPGHQLPYPEAPHTGLPHGGLPHGGLPHGGLPHGLYGAVPAPVPGYSVLPYTGPNHVELLVTSFTSEDQFLPCVTRNCLHKTVTGSF